MAGKCSLSMLPDDILRRVCEVARDEGDKPTIDALLSTCSRLRLQASRVVQHMDVVVDGYGGGDEATCLRDAVATAIRGWPKHAVITSLFIKEAEERDEFHAQGDKLHWVREIANQLAAAARTPEATSAVKRLRVDLPGLYQIGRSDLYTLAARFPLLQRLELGETPLYTRGRHAFRPLAHLHQLTHLSLLIDTSLNRGSEPADGHGAAFVQSLRADLPAGLVAVELRWLAPDDMLVEPGLPRDLQEALELSKAVPGLVKLHLNTECTEGDGSTWEDAQQLDLFAALPNIPGLRHFCWDAWENGRVPSGDVPRFFSTLHSVASLTQCMQLRELVLGTCVVGAAAVALLEMPQLELLQVQSLALPAGGPPVRRDAPLRKLSLVCGDDNMSSLLLLPPGATSSLVIDHASAAPGWGGGVDDVGVTFWLSSPADVRRMMELSGVTRVRHGTPVHLILQPEIEPDLPPGFLTAVFQIGNVFVGMADDI